MDGWIDGWMDGWINGWMDGWMDGWTFNVVYRNIFCLTFVGPSIVIYFYSKKEPDAQFIHSFSSLSYDRSNASSKASSPHRAIQSFLFPMRVSSPFLKVIQ
jgi:hypothetical protein